MKRRLRRRLVITIVLLLIAGGIVFIVRPLSPSMIALNPLIPTAEYLEQNPLPTPEFISELSFISNGFAEFSKSFCAEIDQSHFWVRYSDFPDHQASVIGIQVYVDGDPLTSADMIYSIPLVSITTVEDEFGNEVGWYPSPYTLCFNVGNQSNGLHIAVLEVNGLSGVSQSHTWAFRIEPTPDS